jgi:Na+/melibiose symporter-like transporter
MYALSEGPQRGWTSVSIVAPGVLGLLALIAFVIIELRVPAPMVQLRLLHNTLFRTTLTVAFFASAGFIGTLFLVPLFLQVVRGASPLEAGLATFPEAIGVVVSTQIVARLYPRIGPRRLMAGGLVWMATAIALLGLVGVSGSLWQIRALMFGVGFGMAYVFLPNQAASLATISRADTGRATTFTNIQRQVGAALGVAVLSSVLVAVGLAGAGAADPAAYRIAFFVAAGFALVASVLALRVPDAEAAETMVGYRKRGIDADAPVVEAA